MSAKDAETGISVRFIKQWDITKVSDWRMDCPAWIPHQHVFVSHDDGETSCGICGWVRRVSSEPEAGA